MVTNSSSNIKTAASGKVLQGQGVGTANDFSTATYPSVATSAGTILRADGTNWAASTTTYPNTNAVSTLLYASSANVMSALSTANNGLLVTSNTGVPSILAGPGSTGRILQSNSSAAPSFSTATYPSTAGTSGNVLTSDGTNWVSSAPASGAIGFEATSSSAQSNVTGDGTVFTVIFNNVVWQNGSGYNSGTGVFTVPASSAGIYLITYAVTLGGLTTSNTSAEFKLQSSAGTMTRKLFNPGPVLTGGNYWFSDTVIVSRAVGDTIYLEGQVSGTTKVVSTVADSFGPYCYFSICRLK